MIVLYGAAYGIIIVFTDFLFIISAKLSFHNNYLFLLVVTNAVPAVKPSIKIGIRQISIHLQKGSVVLRTSILIYSGEYPMKLNSMHDLFIDELKDLYSAETQLVQALPKMAKAASSPELQQAFQQHLEETREHVKRVEKIFSALNASPRGKKCVGMEGVIEEGKELLNMQGQPEVIDAGLIGAAQRVEHYEMAGYGTARAHAEQLGHSDAVQLLQQTLNEEEAADEKLTQIATSMVNVQAAK
jgi:ferritin-like metal-binding protein YciE